MSYRQVGRDAETGCFIPVWLARKRRSTATVETIFVPSRRRKRRSSTSGTAAESRHRSAIKRRASGR